MHWFVVFVGGGMGAAARHGVNRLAASIWGPGFPTGTLIVNVLGSLLMGFLIGLFASQAPVSQTTRLFLTTGVLGGFTTFSAFSLDALTLWNRGQTGLTLLYVAASLGLSLLAVAAGLWASRGW